MTKAEIFRNQRWRLGIIRHAEEVTHNVAKTCRYFGKSRNAFCNQISSPLSALDYSGGKIKEKGGFYPPFSLS